MPRGFTGYCAIMVKVLVRIRVIARVKVRFKVSVIFIDKFVIDTL